MAYQILNPQRRGGNILGMLFDMDGVILDSEKLYCRFWREAACSLGYPMTEEQALGMRSLNRDAGEAQLRSYFGPGVIYEEVRDRRIELMDAYVDIHGVDAKPGIHELLDYLEQNGIPAAIATSSPIERTIRYLKPLGLHDRFQAVCTGYDVPKGKPEPDIYIHAAALLGLAPGCCMALEDSNSGLQSAVSAGCAAVFIPDRAPVDAGIVPFLYARADCLTDVIGLLRA